MENWFDFLGDAEPAPDGPRRSSSRDKLAKWAVPIISGCLDGVTPTLHELASIVGDEVSNNVSTILGRGIGGRNGARLHRGHGGAILVCRENVRLMAAFAQKAAFDSMLERRGLDMEQFAAAVAALPSANGG
jgi:hypothetical protein